MLYFPTFVEMSHYSCYAGNIINIVLENLHAIKRRRFADSVILRDKAASLGNLFPTIMEETKYLSPKKISRQSGKRKHIIIV
jgi:hypothetical protein